MGGRRRGGALKEYVAGLPVISVITPVLNAEKTLEETILGVMGQNYPNIEHIVIDGGSTDGTVGILGKYNDLLDYWVSEPDKGIYDAFNKGISLAGGDWLYFLGADDRMYDENVLDDFFPNPHKSKMLYGNVIWGDTGNIYDGKFLKSKLCFRNICHQAIFYHRGVFAAIGLFDLKYPVLADWVFNMRAFASKDINPMHIDRIVAIHSTEGASNKTIDRVFVQEQGTLIRTIFGPGHYLYFKCMTAIRRLIIRHG